MSYIRIKYDYGIISTVMLLLFINTPNMLLFFVERDSLSIFAESLSLLYLFGLPMKHRQVGNAFWFYLWSRRFVVVVVGDDNSTHILGCHLGKTERERETELM